MDDATRFARMISCLGEFTGRMAAPSAGGRMLALEGVRAGLMPVAPGRSVFNSVIYEDATAFEDALPELADAYAEADVHAWTVWVPEADAEVKAMLAAAGHRLDAEPRAMVLDLSDLVPADAGEFETERTEDAACFAETAAAGFGV